MHAGYIPLSQNGTQPCSEEGLNGTVVNPAFPSLYRSLLSLTSTLFLSVRVLITKGIKIDEHHVYVLNHEYHGLKFIQFMHPTLVMGIACRSVFKYLKLQF